MIFRDRLRRDCIARYPDEPRQHIEAASDKIAEWFERNPRGTAKQCYEALEGDGDILVSLTILLVLIQIAYFVKQLLNKKKEAD